MPGSRISAYLTDEGLYSDFTYIASLGNSRIGPQAAEKDNPKTAIYRCQILYYPLKERVSSFKPTGPY
ncbi:hypothetical protein MHI24_20200 [Paenibacillus sp. FSL K6-1096]|uniref:hypothetical protein n=1 Tax=Paenibacillus sp. FSL K6-1096 TaxID=2921460 RepID=UPI0030EB8BDE